MSQTTRPLTLSAGQPLNWSRMRPDAVGSTADIEAVDRGEVCLVEGVIGVDGRFRAGHGLVWALFGTAGTRVIGPADKQGRAVIEAGGSYARVLNGVPTGVLDDRRWVEAAAPCGL